MEFCGQELIEFVGRNYAIQIVDTKELAGYIDKNYKITTSSNIS